MHMAWRAGCTFRLAARCSWTKRHRESMRDCCDAQNFLRLLCNSCAGMTGHLLPFAQRIYSDLHLR